MNDSGNPGPSDGPPNPNEAPEELSTFRDGLEVVNLESMLNGRYEEAGIRTDAQPGSLCVPEFMDAMVFADAVQIGDVIRNALGDGYNRVLLASFFTLSIGRTMPVIDFALAGRIPLVVFASAHYRTWDEAVPINVRKNHPVIPCFSGKGLSRHLGIEIEDDPIKRPGNGLFLTSYSQGEKRNRFIASWLGKSADEPHDLDRIGRRIQIIGT